MFRIRGTTHLLTGSPGWGWPRVPDLGSPHDDYVRSTCPGASAHLRKLSPALLAGRRVTAGRWWHAERERLVCDLCPRRCRLRIGQRGFCFVRQAGAGIELTTWGRATGITVAPIEALPLFHHLPGTASLTLGTAGFTLASRTSDDWRTRQARIHDASADAAAPAAIADAAHRLECRTVAFTVNDPVVFAEYAVDVAGACKELDIGVVARTDGYVLSAPREELFSSLEAVNVTLHGFCAEGYRRRCYGRLEAVQDTLRWIHAQGRPWLELTLVLELGENDSDHELHALSEWVVRELGPDVPLHIQVAPSTLTSEEAAPVLTLHRARTIAVSSGVRFVYLPDVGDPAFETSCCSTCGEALVERGECTVTTWHLREGACPRCRAPLPGQFERLPGLWGAHRMPVRGPRRRRPGP